MKPQWSTWMCRCSSRYGRNPSWMNRRLQNELKCKGDWQRYVWRWAIWGVKHFVWHAGVDSEKTEMGWNWNKRWMWKAVSTLAAKGLWQTTLADYGNCGCTTQQPREIYDQEHEKGWSTYWCLFLCCYWCHLPLCLLTLEAGDRVWLMEESISLSRGPSKDYLQK